MLQAPLLVFLQALWPHLLQYEMLLMLGIMEAKFVVLCTHSVISCNKLKQ